MKESPHHFVPVFLPTCFAFSSMKKILFTILCIGHLAIAQSPKPNIVVLLADDAGWGDYSQNGNQMVRTPNIDSIAKTGVTMDRFYVCPVCSPTRGEFLTGRYHPRGGVKGVSTGQERLNLDEKTVADAFKAAGYATGAFGKWHNGSQWPYHPMARGFDEYFGHTAGHWGEYFDAPLEDNGKMVRTKGYIVDVCTDKALDFIERNKAHPFFCYVPFSTPHSPWAAPDKDWQRLKNLAITQTATDTSKEVTDETRCALAMVENQDWNVGRILTKLKEDGLSENTIVLYFSDNGPNSHRWTGGMKGKKGMTDEGGVRSPFFISWPAKLPKGQMVNQIGGAIDLLFPHHENEIAQSEGATGKLFVKYFVEGEHLLVNGEKMSKSLGNIYNLRDLEEKKNDPLALRYLALTTHYRSKLNFTWKSLQASQNALDKLREVVLEMKKEIQFPKSDFKNPRSRTSRIEIGFLKKYKKYLN